PAAEMKLSDGIAPVAEYLAHGVVVALGTDTAVCNNSNDLFLEMRQLGLVQKVRYRANAAPAEQILRMATRSRARALGGEGAPGWLFERRGQSGVRGHWTGRDGRHDRRPLDRPAAPAANSGRPRGVAGARAGGREPLRPDPLSP